MDVMDVNGDMNIDIVDALLVAQFYVELITEFPIRSQTPAPTSFHPNPPEDDGWTLHIGSSDAYCSEAGDTSTIGIYTSGCEFYYPTHGGWNWVGYTISGTATNGLDYELIQNKVVVAFRSCLGDTGPLPAEFEDFPVESVVIQLIEDDIVEGTETVVLTINGMDPIIIYIEDND